MLIANSTEKGTGIEFWGDYNDLNCLYDAVGELSYFEPSRETEADRERNHRLLSIFPHDVRHAYQGNRKKKEVDNGYESKNTYYGFCTDWITMLFTISALRYNAGLKETDKFIQSQLYLLEYGCETALDSFDPIGASIIKTFINANINVSNKYVYLYHQNLVYDYFSQKPTLKRFRSIPDMFSADKYEQIVSQIEKDMKELGCEICDLSLDLPEYNDGW
jgi:hypothetical protein